MQGMQSLEARCFELKQKLATWHYFEVMKYLSFSLASLSLICTGFWDRVIAFD
jgi:hypothetical protein